MSEGNHHPLPFAHPPPNRAASRARIHRAGPVSGEGSRGPTPGPGLAIPKGTGRGPHGPRSGAGKQMVAAQTGRAAAQGLLTNPEGLLSAA